MANGATGPYVHTSDIVSLRDYVVTILTEMDRRYDQRFCAQQEATRAALNSAQVAIDKAEVNSEKWRANANEWRGQSSDREESSAREALRRDATYLTKDEFSARVGGIDKKVDDLETLRDIALGKASQSSVYVAYALSALGLLVGVIGLVMKFFGK